MVRKVASQVPATVSRLIQSTIIHSSPSWYAPVIANPPPLLPARQIMARSRRGAEKIYTDLPSLQPDIRREGLTRTHRSKQFREPKHHPLAIIYEEDRIRRQFFRDFPFEALRPVSLVEGARIVEEHPIRGLEWTRLNQRGAYPTVENTVAFTLNLHLHHKVAISDAYARATSQFVALRAAHQIATQASVAEACHHGANLNQNEWQRGYDLQSRTVNQIAPSSSAPKANSSTLTTTKYRSPTTWVSSVDPSATPQGLFSAGHGYVQQWHLPLMVDQGAATEGDLVRSVGVETTATQPENDDELDDLALMSAILGTPGHSRGAST